jgi:hypothetical protein
VSVSELVALAITRARALRALMPGTRGRRRQDLEAGAAALELLAERVLELERTSATATTERGPQDGAG